jgi:radical SAM protein with 4Fe4S-binding SPASM domain
MMESDYQLRSCIWELTLRCNMNCLHCGSVAGLARQRELTLAECLQVAEELVTLGCKELTFIGGEVFFYQGWEQVARYFSERGVLVNIMSNGFQIGTAEIEQIRYGGLSDVGISLDGMEKTHDRIRKKGSFAQIRKAFDLLNEAGIPIAVVTSLLELNYPDLPELYAFLVANHVQIWQLQLVNPMGNMASRREMLIRPSRIPRLTEFVREKNKERRMVVLAADSIGYHDEHEPYLRGRRQPLAYWRGCQAGLTSVSIDSVGNVRGCGALYSDVFIEGNVRERGLTAIWNDGEKFAYNRRFDPALLTGRCLGCDVGDVCKGGCRASNYFTSGSLYENAFCCHKVCRRQPLPCDA